MIIIDAQNSCAPYADAQVDIWHCNADGVYSDQAVENTTTETWLRGYQITDANGQVTFQTVVPGWYQGRTTHIHLRIRSSYSNASSPSDGTNTTQLFFDQTLVDTLATSVSPYSAEGKNSTTMPGITSIPAKQTAKTCSRSPATTRTATASRSRSLCRSRATARAQRGVAWVGSPMPIPRARDERCLGAQALEVVPERYGHGVESKPELPPLPTPE